MANIKQLVGKLREKLSKCFDFQKVVGKIKLFVGKLLLLVVILFIIIIETRRNVQCRKKL